VGLIVFNGPLQDKADLIVLGLGANDMLRGIEPKEIKENLNQIIKSIKNKNIPIVLAGFVAPDSYAEKL
jgi:acyl-CoA thioesterase I